MSDGTLVMWSGGVDSTALLYRLAQEGAEGVCAHHVILKDHRNRWGAEEASCRAIRRYFEDRYGIGAVRFSETTIETIYPGPRGFGVHDIFVAAFAAAGYVQCDPEISRVWIGLHADEIGGTDRPAWDRHLQIQTLFRILAERFRPDIGDLEFPLRDMPKSAVIAMLPDELLARTYSCQRYQPARDHWCGECLACQALVRAGKGWMVRTK